jgi:hypothetical protein
VRAAPAVSRAIVATKVRTRAYRFSGEHSDIPCAMALRLISGRPGDRLSCHHHQRDAFASHELDASTGASDPHDFAVRNDIARPRKRCADIVASTATFPSFVTTADAPLGGKGCVYCKAVLPQRKVDYFHSRELTNIWRDLPVGSGQMWRSALANFCSTLPARRRRNVCRRSSSGTYLSQKLACLTHGVQYSTVTVIPTHPTKF